MNRCGEWALYNPKGKMINTNMFVEAFHRLLKTVYLEGKHNRRLDTLMTILFKIAKDYAFTRFIKLNKGKSTHRITEIHKRHRAAEGMMKKGIKATKSGENWIVTSEKDPLLTYTVKPEATTCNNCQLHCSKCGICIHQHSCTCIDAITHTTVCKHMHLVHLSQTKPSPSSAVSAVSLNDNEDTYFVNILQKKKKGLQWHDYRQQEEMNCMNC